MRVSATTLGAYMPLVGGEVQWAGDERLEQALDGHVPLVRGAFVEAFNLEELDVMAGFWRRVEAGLAARSTR